MRVQKHIAMHTTTKQALSRVSVTLLVQLRMILSFVADNLLYFVVNKESRPICLIYATFIKKLRHEHFHPIVPFK
jgi:hypothetical protein